MRIRWLVLALEDMENIISYIAQDDPIAATKTASDIWKTSILLKTQPNLGHPGRIAGTREIFITGTKYIIPYRIKTDEIQILRVIHTSRRWPDSL
jgi:toxin ParE1/3/4